MVGEEKNILRALTQGRKKIHLKRQAVEQVGFESPLCGERPEVCIGCANNSNITPNRLRTADPLKAAILDDTQDFCLGFKRNVSDFIKKESPIVSGLKTAEALAGCSGKSPCFMAE